MFRKTFLPVVFVLTMLGSAAQHPFKFDNTIYKAVYLNEAFHLMDSMQNYLLLDVRSPGEYADTSRSTALNIGRIRGSVNITIDSVPARLNELTKYKDQPVFIYCSHSQRSRRVSKFLAENGFKKVYNINGGMTQLNELDNHDFPFKDKVLTTHLAYKNIDSKDAFHLIKNTPGLVIVDIRTPAEFASGDTLQQNNIGHLKNALNFPQAVFAEKLNASHIPANSPVLLYDLNGYNSMDVVDLLKAKGFTSIYNLFEGLEGFISDHRLNHEQIKELVADAPPYHLVDPVTCIDLLEKHPDMVIIDTRPADEFNNKASMGHANLGRMKGAILLSSPDSLENIILQKNRSALFLVYGAGSDAGTIVCRELIKKGFLHVYLLSQGLYHFVWSTANVENCKAGKEFLTNHEGLY
ncbi:MAG TPA: rhodanese-like domain-containing protein [Puia sp.]|nr:rhodanese-like domain-containing protein [Puia sp.]